MTKQKYWVVGNTHVDLAWKKNRHEMIELLDILLARILDILDSHSTFTYTIEQAAHYRLLEQRRPDLFARVKHYLQAGRLEMMGGMASTLETNFPNGESFVRNQGMGLKWVKEHFGVDVRTAWLIDTFGTNAQVPQILKQFGFHRLLANRFGGNFSEDTFWSQGLDGTKLLVVGKDVNSPYVTPNHLYWGSGRLWDHIDQLFAQAATAQGEGPILITVYTENEVVPSTRPDAHIEKGNAAGQEGLWQYSTYSAFLDALEASAEASNGAWPVIHGDLNPEFTATFPQRIIIRLRNRSAESLLLDAEKWAAFSELDNGQAALEEAWWELAYVQFHDVFTGSHPTNVLVDVLASLASIEASAQDVIQRSLKKQASPLLAAENEVTAHIFNGLPWSRKELVTLPLRGDLTAMQRVLVDGKELPCEVRNGALLFMATLPPMGSQLFTLQAGATSGATTPPLLPTPSAYQNVESATIENEYLLVECSSKHLLKRLVWKETGTVLIENARDLLSLQRDHGSFQIEALFGDEIPATVGTIMVSACTSSAIGQRILLQGVFPAMPAVGEAGFLTWEAQLELRKGKPALYVQLHIQWQGEASRLRFNLATKIKSRNGIYEIPFGTVERGVYRERKTAKGEWPAHRFAAVQDEQHGLALINTGAAGVEIIDGRISTTILRAPKVEYAGMVVDDTSSQHGEHSFNFVVQPYAGNWVENGVVCLAQEANEPLQAIIYQHEKPQTPAITSWMKLSAGSVVLSSVKAGATPDQLVVRFYESAGQASDAELWIAGAKQAWKSDLMEVSHHESLSCIHETIKLHFQPFEIVTIIIER